MDVLPTPNTMDMLPARDGEALERTRRRGDMNRPLTTVSNLRERVMDVNGAHSGGRGIAWGKYTPAIRRWEHILGRDAPAPTEPNPRTGKPQLSARFTEWMMGLPDGWITSVPGITRNEAIKACGNGVVPQQAIYALTVMRDREGDVY